MKTHLNKAHTTPEQWQTDMMFARLEKTDPDRKLEVLIDVFKEFCGELRNSQQNLKKNFEAVEKGIQGLQAYAPQNLLLNPRFKSWSNGATANPDGWTGVASGTPQQAVPVIQGISAEGYACKMGAGDSKVQAVSCKPSTIHMVSLWVGNTSTGAGWVSLFDNGSVPRSTQYDIAIHTLSGYQWKYIVIPITTAPDATTLTFSANCSAGAVRICELYLHEGKYDMPSITNDLWSRLTELQNTVNTLTVDADTLDTHDSTEFPIEVPGTPTNPPYTPPPTKTPGGIWKVPQVSPPGAGMTATPKGAFFQDPADDKFKYNTATPPSAPSIETIATESKLTSDIGTHDGLASPHSGATSVGGKSIPSTGFAGKIGTPTAGNFVSQTAGGDMQDSGYKHSDFATAAQANATHTGEVTGATALTIADDAVTYAKMQNVSATDKLLGRVSAGAGDVEEVSCTDGAQTDLANSTNWADYSPSWTATGTQPVLGAGGVLNGRWRKSGKTAIVHIYLLTSAATTYGTGAYLFSLPVAAQNTTTVTACGGAIVIDATGNIYTCISRVIRNSATVDLITNNSATRVGATNPITFASGDEIDITITYEYA